MLATPSTAAKAVMMIAQPSNSVRQVVKVRAGMNGPRTMKNPITRVRRIGRSRLSIVGSARAPCSSDDEPLAESPPAEARGQDPGEHQHHQDDLHPVGALQDPDQLRRPREIGGGGVELLPDQRVV